MKIRLIFFILILVFGSSLLLKTQLKRMDILNSGKEIRIEKDNFSTPINCEYLTKNNSKFLKFNYKNKSHSLRIKSKDCMKIKKQNFLLLMTNKKQNVFIYDINSLKIELISSFLIFLLVIICAFKFLIHNYKQ